jgi:hypothetical protein
MDPGKVVPEPGLFLKRLWFQKLLKNQHRQRRFLVKALWDMSDKH